MGQHTGRIHCHVLCGNGLHHLLRREQAEFSHFAILVDRFHIGWHQQVVDPQGFIVPTAGHGSAGRHLALRDSAKRQRLRQAGFLCHFAHPTALQRLSHSQAARGHVVQHARVSGLVQGPASTPHVPIFSETIDMHSMRSQTKKSVSGTFHFKRGSQIVGGLNGLAVGQYHGIGPIAELFIAPARHMAKLTQFSGQIGQCQAS